MGLMKNQTKRDVRVKELIEMNLGITDATEFGRCHRVPAKTNSSNN